MLRFLPVFLAVFMSTCATPPKQIAFDNSQTYAMPKEQVWDALLRYFTTHNIQIKTIEKDSGVIYAERSRVDNSISDCGDSGLSIEVSRTGTMNVLVQPQGDQTTVTVNTTFVSTREFDRSYFTAPCVSTGMLERDILSSIEQSARRTNPLSG